MKAVIYKYFHDRVKYYGEGYGEEDIRLALEKHLKLEKGTLRKGVLPDYRRELKLLWNRKNKTHRLTLTKEQTTNKEQLYDFRKKQHTLYELKLLLSEDENFLTGVRGDIVADKDNDIKFWNSKYIKDDGEEIGNEMCYSFKGSTTPEYTCNIYRFKGLSDAYHYVRGEIINNSLKDHMFNKNLTCLEACDSFIVGFGNASWCKKNEDLFLIEKSQSNYYKNLDL